MSPNPTDSVPASLEEKELELSGECGYDEYGDRGDFNEDEEDDGPCVRTCCLCCNIGLGSILGAIGFLVFNGIYIARQMSNLKDALDDGSVRKTNFKLFPNFYNFQKIPNNFYKFQKNVNITFFLHFLYTAV
jgi:hypothetical protein